MKAPFALALAALSTLPLRAEEPDFAVKTAEHQQGARKLSGEQDELAADVQQLAIEQTAPKVIELLKQCEDLMGEASERLSTHDTGGETISAQTEVIEKIYQAAKARQQQQQQGGSGESGGAMLDMMERMMGKSPASDQAQGSKPGEEAGDQAGKGMTGDSSTANGGVQGAGDGKEEERRVPKATGTAGKGLPEEFRQALDAYNRGAEKLAK